MSQTKDNSSTEFITKRDINLKSIQVIKSKNIKVNVYQNI